MMRLAFEFWTKYTRAGVDWRSLSEWKDALANIAGTVTTTDDNGNSITVDVMARDYWDGSDEGAPGNPDWRGKILVQKFNQNGEPTGWSLSRL